jgi:hypothetical protein
MRRRWQLILPTIGLMLFGGVTYESLERRQHEKAHGQYFWWASIRLDTHRVNREPNTVAPCKIGEGDCVVWDVASLPRSPGLLGAILIMTAFPAFVIGMPIVRLLGSLGISEVPTFMIVMPVLIAGWYYALAWLDARWRSRRPRPARS